MAAIGPGPGPVDLPPEAQDALRKLARIVEMRESLEELEAGLLVQLRQIRVPWRDIADAMELRVPTAMARYRAVIQKSIQEPLTGGDT